MTIYAKNSFNFQASFNTDYSSPFATADAFPSFQFNPGIALNGRVNLINGTTNIDLSPFTSIDQVLISTELTNLGTLQVNYTDNTTNHANQVTISIGAQAMLCGVKVSTNLSLISTGVGFAWILIIGT